MIELFDPIFELTKDSTTTNAILDIVTQSSIATDETPFFTAESGILAAIAGILGFVLSKFFGGSKNNSQSDIDKLERQVTSLQAQLKSKTDLAETYRSQKNEAETLANDRLITIKDLDLEIKSWIVTVQNREETIKQITSELAQAQIDLSKALTEKQISISEAKEKLEEAIRIKGYHIQTLKELGLTEISQAAVEQFLKDNPDVNDIKMVSEFASWMRWTGTEEAMNNYIKNS